MCTQDEGTLLFTEFPIPALLKNSNEIAARNNTFVAGDDEEDTSPYPRATWKKEVFSADKFAKLDAHAVEVGAACRSPGTHI